MLVSPNEIVYLLWEHQGPRWVEGKNFFHVGLGDDNVPTLIDLQASHFWFEVAEKQGTKVLINFQVLHLEQTAKWGLQSGSSLVQAEQ